MGIQMDGRRTCTKVPHLLFPLRICRSQRNKGVSEKILLCSQAVSYKFLETQTSTFLECRKPKRRQKTCVSLFKPHLVTLTADRTRHIAQLLCKLRQLNRINHNHYILNLGTTKVMITPGKTKDRWHGPGGPTKLKQLWKKKSSYPMELSPR